MTLSYAITAYWNYDETLNDINRLFDEQLIESNLLLQNIDPKEMDRLSQLDQGKHSVNEAYQLWTTSGELLHRSSDATHFPLSDHTPGMKSFQLGNYTWYTYTVVDSAKDRIYITAQRGDMRADLAHELSIRHIIPVVIIFPLVAMTIWILIAHGFRTLSMVIRQLNDRQYDNLSPITTKALPIEISPTVAALNALFERLNSAYEREQRFTADAAHELRTPLAAIRTMAQLALGYKDIKAVHECLHDVLQGVDRCTHVVKQLAVLNSLRPEEIMHEVTQVNVNQVMEQIANELRIMAEKKKISLVAHMPAPCFITANLASMQILLRNLIDNAIRYSPPSSTVTLSTEILPEEVLIKICDQGPGIPESLHDRVFERFYRQLGTQQNGTGLGLSIVATICQLHAAKVELGSGENGQGLLVTLRFNASKMPKCDAGPASRGDAKGSNKAPKVRKARKRQKEPLVGA
jgi:two-component system sensor histidine kinase QseC